METSLSHIEALALTCLDELPKPFRDHAQNIVVRVEALPAQRLLDDLGIDDPLELTGLYEGVALTEKHFSDPDPFPDVITLFRDPMLAELEERDGVTLEELVRHVMIHELAHHFGWSDADIATVDRWWE